MSACVWPRCCLSLVLLLLPPVAIMSLDDVPITIDDDYRVRVLDPEKTKRTEQLAGDCKAFVDKIQEFSTTVHSLVEVMDAQASKIENQKLKAIGLRNLVESEVEDRLRKKKALQAQINEKVAELERCTSQLESLQRVENEQRAMIEKLSNNEV